VSYALCNGKEAFDGWRLEHVLQPMAGTLACRRLRLLNLTRDLGLVGEIPTCLQQLRQVRHLCVNHNPLTGSMPEWLGDLPHLELFDLMCTRISGPIPDSIGGAVKLKHLGLGHMRFSGRLPQYQHAARKIFLWADQTGFATTFTSQNG
jgi:hypothetical protein